MSAVGSPQHTVIIVKSPHKEPTVLAKTIGSLMGPVTTVTCGVVFAARLFDQNCTGMGDAAIWAVGAGVVMSIATLILQKSADTLVDATIFLIKLPFNIIAYPFTSGSSKADQIAKEFFSNADVN